MLGEIMELTDGLIELRILLQNYCDGFESNGKTSSLSIRQKILFLLQSNDCSPHDLGETLCLAKGNIANILKKMITEGLVENYKCENNSKNVFYKITSLGIKKLNDYKEKMLKQFLSKCADSEHLTNSLDSIINTLKGNMR
jgi:DNA-binding MarR family transcriptional regulator